MEGGWKGGHPYFHAELAYINMLACDGWIVACCSYRKNIWPQHHDDAMDAFKFVMEKYNPSSCVIGGTSAGVCANASGSQNFF